MKPIATNIADFETLRRAGLVYVDKTAHPDRASAVRVVEVSVDPLHAGAVAEAHLLGGRDAHSPLAPVVRLRGLARKRREGGVCDYFRAENERMRCEVFRTAAYSEAVDKVASLGFIPMDVMATLWDGLLEVSSSL